MVVLIILSFIAILCTYFESKGKLRNGMLLGFVILSAILGLSKGGETMRVKVRSV